MNKKSIQEKAKIIQLLCEGNSLRATSRIANCSINTVTKILVEAGQGCIAHHDETARNLPCQRVQCDEIWSFVYSKEVNTDDEEKGFKNGKGDAWTWVGIDADSKFVVSWYLGRRDADSAQEFICDISERLANRVQMTVDGLTMYLNAVDRHFKKDIDFAQLVKLYGTPKNESRYARKYSPADCTGIEKKIITGNPDEKHISTSYVERQNLTMRMHMRRFTRLTNAFSKKWANHAYAIALHFTYYNYVRVHKTLKVTPATHIGLTQDAWSFEDIAKLTEPKLSQWEIV